MFKCCPRDTIGLWLRAARPRNGEEGGVDGRLGAVPQGQSIRQYLDAAAISNVDIHVPQEDVGCNSCTGFAADSRRGSFQGCPACSENARRRTSCTVVTQGIERTSTPAPPWPDWHGQPQASEQHNAETRARESELRSCGRCCEGARAAKDCLGQHQRSRSRVKVRKNARASGGVQAGRGGSLPSSQLLSKGALNKRTGARHRQVHPRSATRSRLPAAASLPLLGHPKPPSLKGSAARLRPRSSMCAGASLARRSAKMRVIPSSCVRANSSVRDGARDRRR